MHPTGFTYPTRLPFEGENRLAAGYRRVHEDAPDPGQLSAGRDPELAQLIRRMLSREPIGRPTAAEVAETLGGPRTVDALTVPRLQREAPALTRRMTGLTETRPRLNRTRVAVAAGGAALAVGVGVAVVTVRGSRDSAPPTAALPATLTRTEVRTETTTGTATLVLQTTVRASRSSTPAAGALDRYDRFDGIYFSASLPASWELETAEESKGSYHDTTLRHPNDDRVMIRIDTTPRVAGSAYDHALEVEAYLVRQSTYSRIAMRSSTFNGYEAVEWEFLVTERGSRLRKVDIFFNDYAGNGFAVLTQAPVERYATFEPIFDRVRQSIAPTE